MECWRLSRGLRAVLAAYGLGYGSLIYVIVRFLFPRVLLAPVTVTAAVLYIVLCVARLQVALDRSAGEVAITTGFWTRHVRLTQVERVAVKGSGVRIKVAAGDTYELGLFGRRRWPARRVRLRSGFEGMELAIPAAAAAARAADPARAAAEDAGSRRAAARRKIPAACFACGAGVFSLAAAAAVRPQAASELVHVLALLLRIYFLAGGCMAVLIGTGLLYSAWRGRCGARRYEAAE